MLDRIATLGARIRWIDIAAMVVVAATFFFFTVELRSSAHRRVAGAGSPFEFRVQLAQPDSTSTSLRVVVRADSVAACASRTALTTRLPESARIVPVDQSGAPLSCPDPIAEVDRDWAFSLAKRMLAVGATTVVIDAHGEVVFSSSTTAGIDLRRLLRGVSASIE